MGQKVKTQDANLPGEDWLLKKNPSPKTTIWALIGIVHEMKLSHETKSKICHYLQKKLKTS